MSLRFGTGVGNVLDVESRNKPINVSRSPVGWGASVGFTTPPAGRGAPISRGVSANIGLRGASVNVGGFGASVGFTPPPSGGRGASIDMGTSDGDSGRGASVDVGLRSSSIGFGGLGASVGPSPPPSGDRGASAVSARCSGVCSSEHPVSSLVHCSKKHALCISDARKYLAKQIRKGVAALTLTCTATGCDEVYPGSEIIRFIDLNLLKGIPPALNQTIIRRLGIDEFIEICEKCDTVIACGSVDKNEIMICTNPTCGNEMCRLCHNPAHGRLSCQDAANPSPVKISPVKPSPVKPSSAKPSHSVCSGPCASRYHVSELVYCGNNHALCIPDARKYLTAQIQKGTGPITCIVPGCGDIYPVKDVLRFIDLKTFHGMPRSWSEMVIERINMKGLVEICENCDTVVVCGPVDEDQIMVCTNPTCHNEMCRLCRNSAHGIVSCEDTATVANLSSNNRSLSVCSGACASHFSVFDLIYCRNNHGICIAEGRRFYAMLLVKGAAVLKCQVSGCGEIYVGKEILRFIDLDWLKGIPKAQLRAFIDSVGVKELVEICNSCDTVVVCGSIEETAIMICTNPNCSEEVCRLCRNPAHYELTCGEADAVANPPPDPSLCSGACASHYSMSYLIHCSKNHGLCIPDAQTYLETLLENGVAQLHCVSGCGEIYPGTEVLRFINLDIFNRIPLPRLGSIIDSLGLKELVEICDYCGTVVICGPIEEEEIMVCTNPACGKDMCRLCRQHAHGILNCEDAETAKGSATSPKKDLGRMMKADATYRNYGHVQSSEILNPEEDIPNYSQFPIPNDAGTILKLVDEVVQPTNVPPALPGQATTATGFIKPSSENIRNLPVRLVLCFDGTGDTAQGSVSAMKCKSTGTKDSIKSIFDLSKAGPVVNSDGRTMFQFVQYFEGVGTAGMSPDAGILTRVGSLFDSATGNGYLDILKNGYKACCQHLQKKGKDQHEVFIFGFSRGAFISRALASFLQHVGIVKEEFLDKGEQNDQMFQERFRELLHRYCSMTRKSWVGQRNSNPEPEMSLLPFCIPSPRVRLVGAFDTVKTVIPLPIHNYLAHQIPNIDFEMDAPGIVDHFRHALALNEARPLFNPDLWKSAAGNASSSYLEAWFFGYHHDIGGGDDVQGLALWPLQWILHAAVEYGLVLDTSVEPYEVLFSGTDNVIQTPHEVALKMFDMIRHHSMTKSWGLKLNEPFSLMMPQPRTFFQYLTTPPYLKFVKPKVFLHPSAYLVFDVSSLFRIQVYEWMHFRKFLKCRFDSLPMDEMPWWEDQTVQSILKEPGAVEHLNLLVIGPPGTGKREFVETMFGQTSGLKNHKISIPISIPSNNQVRIYYSDGLGTDSNDDRDSIMKFLEENRNNTDIESQIHAMWYFLDATQEEMPASEKELFHMNFGNIPVLVIPNNQDKLTGITSGQSLADGGIDLNLLNQFNKVFQRMQQQTGDLPVKKFVQARNPQDTIKKVLSDTASSFADQSINIAQIKAQRIEIKPKIALAAEESVRAYTIWHTFKTTGQRYKFSRNKDPFSMKLSTKLMEPILATFNMRFSGDGELIQSLIGAQWSALDHYASGLYDPGLPGDLILNCMLDTVLVMAHAVSHQQIKGKIKQFLDIAHPLSKSDVEQACAYYTASKENKQLGTHRKIQEILTPHGTPKHRSIATMQMQIIELIELQSESSSLLFGCVGAVRGAVEGVVGRPVGEAVGAARYIRGFGI